MTWIRSIEYQQSDGKLRSIYERIKGPHDQLDNILKAHGLRPHTLEGHMLLYKNVLHHAKNEIPKWFLETIGVWVSQLNQCGYCVRHHQAGLARLTSDQRATEILAALSQANPTDALSAAEWAAMDYVTKLTQEPWTLEESDASRLRAAGWTDGQILEINQTASYFAYANRTVLGLGVTTDGDELGLSPHSTDESDWSHS